MDSKMNSLPGKILKQLMLAVTQETFTTMAGTFHTRPLLLETRSVSTKSREHSFLTKQQEPLRDFCSKLRAKRGPLTA